MIDENKTYSLAELIDMYKMYNLEFKFYGNNQNGTLEFYVKTDAENVSVFTSIDKMTKQDYLKLTEDEAKETRFKFDRKVKDMDLDIVAIVLRTSDVNIPSTKYSLETLDKLTKEQDKEDREIEDGFESGISYLIVDNNTACTLYDGVYLFNKNNDGLISDLKNKYQEEKSNLIKNNLNIILNYINNKQNQKEMAF